MATGRCSYRAMKRQALIAGGPALLERPTDFAPPLPCVMRDVAAAVALGKILVAERQEARQEATRQLQRAALAVERGLSRRWAAARALQRYMRCWLQRRQHCKHAASARIARWYQHHAKRRQAALVQLCLRLEAMQHTMSPPREAPVEAPQPPLVETLADRGLRLRVLGLRQLVSPVPPPLHRHSTLLVELQLRQRSTGHTAHSTSQPVPFAEAAVAWPADTALVVHAADIHDWIGTVRLLHRTSDGTPRCIGLVQVPVDLLQSPLATAAHSLTRWFPLEKTAPSDLVRGDARIELTYNAGAPPVQFEQLDWSNVAAKTNSNLSRPRRAASEPAKERPALGLDASTSTIKMELMHLKQKTELHTIFQRKAASRVPVLSKERLLELQRIQAAPAAYRALATAMEAEYQSLRAQLYDGAKN
ncbi:hypothetical protein ACHHYP_05678 [Achlya hypogyna]|uniref:C2 domain-containing protein n=1 Tax=Achlya hypogyna TaxID=1202772 RepID=A0A1V9YWS6_ACHHY|nr:hypothetical protein ACHHYP_05678 [Achlya hypogyna]